MCVCVLGEGKGLFFSFKKIAIYLYSQGLHIDLFEEEEETSRDGLAEWGKGHTHICTHARAHTHTQISTQTPQVQYTQDHRCHVSDN